MRDAGRELTRVFKYQIDFNLFLDNHQPQPPSAQTDETRPATVNTYLVNTQRYQLINMPAPETTTYPGHGLACQRWWASKLQGFNQKIARPDTMCAAVGWGVSALALASRAGEPAHLSTEAFCAPSVACATCRPEQQPGIDVK